MNKVCIQLRAATSSAALLVLLSGCAGFPSLQTVTRKFQRENPHSAIVRTTLSQQWLDGHVYPSYGQYSIVYREPGGTKEHERVYLYHQAAEAVVYGGSKDIR